MARRKKKNKINILKKEQEKKTCYKCKVDNSIYKIRFEKHHIT